ncbi:MAG: hypothetical protein HC795_08710 [Coleofasciculaceae cyanobacterium RL_1_1]|nr:hypothetical protein [Coleofasciculaceae cyanobacterium RL_1_1]
MTIALQDSPTQLGLTLENGQQKSGGVAWIDGFILRDEVDRLTGDVPFGFEIAADAIER